MVNDFRVKYRIVLVQPTFLTRHYSVIDFIINHEVKYITAVGVYWSRKHLVLYKLRLAYMYFTLCEL